MKKIQQEENFRRADFYSSLSYNAGNMVRERSAASDFPYTERHLKCVWYDSRLRPAELSTAWREPVRVVNPGRWNLEAGPDFLDAVLLVGPERRRVEGDVEIHVRPSDWQRHGHAANPNYRRLAAHVTFFPGYLPDGVLPPGVIQVALQPVLARDPVFAFEHLDLAAYPAAAPIDATPCGSCLADWNADRIRLFLTAAGEERLRCKSVRLQSAIAARGAEQVFYEEILCALGYKHNRGQFRELAARLPLAALREAAGGHPESAYALLAGVSGLLPDDMEGYDRPTRLFIRQMWDIWWKFRGSMENCIMPAGYWQRGGSRPQNHPLRRMMAAAWLFGGKADLKQLWDKLARSENPRRSIEILAGAFELPDSYYWKNRISLRGVPQPNSVRLLGTARLAAVFMNVIAPFMAAQGRGYPPEFLDLIPPEESNALARRMARALLGVDHGPGLYRTGLMQQGLLQIGADFCLEIRENCADCRLPAALSDCQTMLK